MNIKSSFSILLLIFIHFEDAHSAESYGIADLATTPVEAQNHSKECLDISGHWVKHAARYVPPGIDMCRHCKCENGYAKECQNVLCAPPDDCRSFQMGSTCCEFTCLDRIMMKKQGQAKTVSRVITSILGIVSLIVVISCCICLCKRVKSKRDRLNTAKKASKIAFSEDLYLKMSVEMIEKNEEIISLKKRIEVLETRLNNGEKLDQISKADCDAWKKAYDLHVDLKD